MGIVFVGLNLVVDLLYVWIDPRIRLGNVGAVEGAGA